MHDGCLAIRESGIEADGVANVYVESERTGVARDFDGRLATKYH
jgi:hypothetical protein